MNRALASAPGAPTAEAMRESAGPVEAALDRLLPRAEGPDGQLAKAMRYACLGGGKRLRPFLLLSTAALFGVDEAHALRAAAAVEMVHCYSLVHDDLPAMDDDELRRGRPTCHIAFGEAAAILAGDALLTLAFDVLADSATHDDAAVRIDLIRGLAEASGAHGMVAGQIMDLSLEGRAVDAAAVERLQMLKTGALIAFSAEAGAILGRADADAREAVLGYGRDLGLAFQVADDLLDEEGDAATVGKAVGKDAAAGKATLVGVLGPAEARRKAGALADSAIASLDGFGERAAALRALARFVVTRQS